MTERDMSGCALRPLLFGVFAMSAAFPDIAGAHLEGDTHADWALAWNVTPDIFFGTLVFALLYINGVRSLPGRWRASAQLGRHLSFFGGLGVIFIALQSPLDAIAGRSFFAHQVQHLLLQTAAPILLMLAAPQRALIAGTPDTLKRWLLVPAFFNTPVRGAIGFLTLPWVAALLLVGSLYIWHWPPYHDLAVLNDGVHYLMHFTMLAAGLVFYWCVFDPRPAPLGATYSTRWSALVFTMTANMLLGAALFLKGTVLYSAYDSAGRLWEIGALTDEQLGGLIMWIPGSMAGVPAFLVLLRTWHSWESRIDERRRRGIPARKHIARTGNLRFALRLAVLAVLAFATTLGVGLVATGQITIFSH